MGVVTPLFILVFSLFVGAAAGWWLALKAVNTALDRQADEEPAPTVPPTRLRPTADPYRSPAERRALAELPAIALPLPRLPELRALLLHQHMLALFHATGMTMEETKAELLKLRSIGFGRDEIETCLAELKQHERTAS